MKYQPSKIDDSNTVFIWLLVVMVFLAGCATGPAPQEKAPMTRQITSIGTQQDAGAISVLIQGNRMLTYSSVKHPMPLSVIFYFPETILDKLTVPRIAENDIIKTIEALQSDGKEQTARVNVVLKQDAAYEVAQADKGLIISFKKKSSEAPPVQIEEIRKEETEIKTDPMSAETPLPVHLRSITAAKLNDGIQLNILADGRIRDYKSFTIDHPARIVFDLIDVQHTTAKEQVIPVNTPWVHQVRYYAYSDRLRIVLETQKKYLTAYLASPLEEGLAVYVGDAKALPAAGPAAVDSRQAPAAGQTGPAWINRIDFLAENAGRSTLVIGTTRKVNFKIDRAQENRLLLKLFETRLPDYRKHALITTRFQSAVDRVIPFEQGAPKAAMILVEMREAVPYLVEQVDNLLFLRFEPSKIPPKPLEAARLPSWKQVLRETLAEPEAGKEAAPAGPVATQPDAPSDKAVLPAGPGQKYSGEKIALDFYDTDIKNVFRILREVSGKNFAIEKDVAGKVTLALAKPVPWDQVLDLVLKMNQLGMREEGNIIRIATLKTLDGEAQARQAKIASETKVIEQQQALEPLVTEYIHVNYANAIKDILPKIEKIVTKDRGGSASVDERTNMIIMIDTSGKIKQAKEIISQLDTVTPQVIIEARIVEATTDFSRAIGINWGIEGDQTTSHGPFQGTYGYQTALNLPVAATNPASIGLSFARLTGSPLIINATLTASESQGDVNIISAPKIVTLDNKEAVIKQGVKQPYNVRDESGNTTTAFQDVSLELKVKPQVTSDDRILMTLSVINNELGAEGAGGVRSITSKEAKTELLVNDGDTVVIGGIRKTSKNESESGVPGFSKIPLLGWLFKSTSKTQKKEELLIFITPTIVKLEERSGQGPTKP